MHKQIPRGRVEPERSTKNVGNNSQKFPKLDEKHESAHPRSLTKPSRDKFKELHSKKHNSQIVKRQRENLDRSSPSHMREPQKINSQCLFRNHGGSRMTYLKF